VHILKKLYLRLPFRNKTKKLLLTSFRDLLDEGQTSLGVINILIPNFNHRRVKLILTSIKAQLVQGYELSYSLSMYSNLFGKDLILFLKSTEDSASSISLSSLFSIQVYMLNERSALIKDCLVPLLPSLMLTIGLFLGIAYNSYTDLWFIRNKIIQVGTFGVPAPLEALFVSFNALFFWVLPSVSAILLLFSFKQISRIPLFNLLRSFFEAYVPPFNIVSRLKYRTLFIMVLKNVLKGGSLLQDALLACYFFISNRFQQKEYLKCLNALYSGLSFQTSFERCSIIAPADRDAIFAARESLVENLAEIEQRYVSRKKVTRQSVVSVIRLALIFFSLYWLIAFILAWFSLMLRYIKL
jgi:hypothetical protein